MTILVIDKDVIPNGPYAVTTSKLSPGGRAPISNSADQPSLGVSSDTGSNEELEKIFADVAKAEFSGISGVRDVSVSGVVEKRVNLKFNQALLAANGLSTQSVVSALQANGFVIPAGTIDDGKGNISVEVGTPVNSLEDSRTCH